MIHIIGWKIIGPHAQHSTNEFADPRIPPRRTHILRRLSVSEHVQTASVNRWCDAFIDFMTKFQRIELNSLSIHINIYTYIRCDLILLQQKITKLKRGFIFFFFKITDKLNHDHHISALLQIDRHNNLPAILYMRHIQTHKHSKPP